MDSCQCSHSLYVDTPVAPLPNHALCPGDVYFINESICTPIYDILRQPQSNLERTQYIQSQQSFHSICSKETATKHENGRPCIVMQHYRDPFTRRMSRKVCLVTTYSGRHISTLPKICKEFSVPVYPHYAITPDSGDDHVHSMPRWSRENAWIVAWIFTTSRPLIRALRARREAGQLGENIAFGETAMEYILETCENLREEWFDKCKNPKFAGPYNKEFHVSMSYCISTYGMSRLQCKISGSSEGHRSSGGGE